MSSYRIIGNMTGNSMDAIDLVLTEFDGDKMTDICTFSHPYNKDMQRKIENLRTKVFAKTADEINNIPEFRAIHDEYIKQIAECIDLMCRRNNIDKTTIDAIGFHGKTLDHNPPSKAKTEKTQPYTLQIGSGQMLADLTELPVVYDFRSDLLMAGFDGAPLVPTHNAHIAASDGIYYNGGNTANFAVVIGNNAQIAADAGPFNEYIDSYIRLHTAESYDKDGQFGNKGKLNINLLQKIWELGHIFYELPLPKSGDPAYYHKNRVIEYITKQKIKFEDAVYTLEYAAAYVAAHALTLVPDNINLPKRLVLFGGGWKNPVVLQSFKNLLQGKNYILPQHQSSFVKLQAKLAPQPLIQLSDIGDYMEARLMADMARYKLDNKAWELPETIAVNKKIVCGKIALPQKMKTKYTDYVNRAAKGWQIKQHNN